MVLASILGTTLEHRILTRTTLFHLHAVEFAMPPSSSVLQHLQHSMLSFSVRFSTLATYSNLLEEMKDGAVGTKGERNNPREGKVND